jgi:hypothetical protein
VLIDGAKSALMFQFDDGRIAVGQDGDCRWSTDHGRTWSPGPAGPGDKVALDLGGGEILSINRNSRRRADGKFDVRLRRSFDNWRTVASESAVLDLPDAGSTVTGSGGVIDGFLSHHGLLQLQGGHLIATMYGNYRGDTELCQDSLA